MNARQPGRLPVLLFTLAALLLSPQLDASRALASEASSAPSYLETRIGASEIEGRDLIGALGALSAEERSGYAFSSGGSAAGEHLQLLVHNATSLDANGFWNYHLTELLPDGARRTYYHGMAGPNQKPADVLYRHSKNHSRFNPANGDEFVRDNVRVTYGKARVIEDTGAVGDKTILEDPRGKNRGNYRGNRQRPIGARNAKKYPGRC